MNNKGIIVGKDKQTNEDVLWSEADRRKHMIIVGPTGSGKTSQSIIPFMAQDLQNENMGITLIEPKGDLALRINELASEYGRKAFFFDIKSKSNAIPNPLKGDIADVIENFVMAYRTVAVDSSTFVLNIGEQLIKDTITVLKAVNGEETNLVEFNKFIHNTDDYGTEMIKKFSYLTTISAEEEQKKKNTIKWFKKDYFAKKSKLFKLCSDIRVMMNNLVEAYGLEEKVADKEIKEIDFEKHLEDGDVVIISTSAGKMGAGYHLYNQLISLSFQSAVFRRKCLTIESKMNAVYIDELQMYVNSNFIQLVAQGASYNVALHLATQARSLIGMGLMASDIGPIEGVDAICANIRNVIVYPGVNVSDAEYYSKQFGEVDGKAIVTVADIEYGKFGEATCALIKDGKLQKPIVLKNKYI
ncbi:type IV secretory system conjugative DNA transfer family protein [Lysinibacillus sp. UGB7]|uniref:type IV secretory system conjugative DNA transfer family protein n=1 Tax=Lysinibacillus sp. UGB7 TaxID=3411039 RepID=UPI003B767369